MCIWQCLTLFYRKCMPLRYAETRSVRLISLAEDVFYTLVVDDTSLSKFSCCSVFTSIHPAVHLLGLKLVVNLHQIMFLICVIFGKTTLLQIAETYSVNRFKYSRNKVQSWAKQGLCWVYLESEKGRWALTLFKYNIKRCSWKNRAN